MKGINHLTSMKSWFFGHEQHESHPEPLELKLK